MAKKKQVEVICTGFIEAEFITTTGKAKRWVTSALKLARAHNEQQSPLVTEPYKNYLDRLAKIHVTFKTI